MAGLLTIPAFKKALASGSGTPVFAAIGGEPFLMDKVANIVSESVDDMTRDFNFDSFHGDELDAGKLAGALSALPMMAERRIIIVKHFNAITPTLKKYIAGYVKKPVPSTLLVLLFDGDGKVKWITDLLKHVQGVDCQAPKGRALEKWVNDFVSGLGVTISNEAMDLVTEGRAVRLIDVAGELEKAALLVGDGNEISIEILQMVWGIEADINIWDFYDTAAAGNRKNALEVMQKIRSNIDKEMGPMFSNVARRWRTAWKEKVYDIRRVPFANREWAGNSKRQWTYASSMIKSLPPTVSEKGLERLLELDRARKTRTVDDVAAFEAIIHKTALDRERRRS